MSVEERPPASQLDVSVATDALSRVASWRVRGVRLYLLFDLPGGHSAASPPGEAVRPDAQTRPTYWHDMRLVEGWRLHEVAVPTTIAPDGRILEPESPLGELNATMDAMIAEAKQRRQTGGADTTIRYAIVHLVKLLPPDETPSGTTIPPHVSDVRPQLHALLDTLDQQQAHEPRGYFEQYESAGPGHSAQRGHLGVGVRAALLAGLSDDTFRVFATLIQSGSLAADRGFTREGFSVVLNRVAQWNASQDLVESVERLAHVQAELGETSQELTALRASGDAATRGQIWLSYALAAIGVGLSFLTFVKPPVALLPGLLLFGLSCFAQSRYAQTQQFRWHRVGKVIFALATIATILGVLVPVILSHNHIHLFG